MAKTPISKALVFKKEWIFDPGPEWLQVSKADAAKINQLKTQFVKEVNGVIKAGQK